MEYFRSTKLAYTLFVYFAVFSYGVCEMSRSINFPLFKDAYGLSYGEQGTMLTTTQWCYIAMTIAATVLLPYLKYKKLNALGYFLAMVGSLLVFILSSKWAILIGFHIIYLGFGLQEIGLNCFLSAYFTHNTGVLMNVFHGVYGVGALLGPLVAGEMAGVNSMGFRLFYIAAAVLLVLVLVYMLFLNLDQYYEPEKSDSASSQAVGSPSSPMSAGRAEGEYNILKALWDPVIYLSILALGLQTNVEMAASSWAVLYIKDVLHLDAERDGSLFMTIFYVFFTAARLLFGGVFERIGFLNSLQVSAWGGLVFFVIGFVTGSIGRYFLMVTGLFVAIFWPCMMCTLMQIYGSNAPKATSYVISIHCVFGTLLSLAQGYLNEYLGPAWGYRTAIPLSLVVSLVVGAIQVIQYRAESYSKIVPPYMRKMTVLLHSTAVSVGSDDEKSQYCYKKDYQRLREGTLVLLPEEEILSMAEADDGASLEAHLSVAVHAKNPDL